MADSGVRQSTTTTSSRSESTFYRRPPGLLWLLGLLAIPLVLAAIGFAGTDRSGSDAVVGADDESVVVSVSTPAPSAVASSPSTNSPAPELTPFSIARNGNDVTISGDVPDADTKAALLDAIKASLGDGLNFVDELSINPDVGAPDIPSLSSVLTAASAIPDFGLAIDAGKVTFTGTAATEADRAALEAAASSAWPDTEIVNEVTVGASSAPGGAECTTLQTDVDALLSAPITFDTDGFTLTQATLGVLAQVADAVAACSTSRIAVAGYTDDTGNDAINVPLSANRAKEVADYLVAQGVAASQVTSEGLGSADPVADNSTPQGRSENRRVEITVS